MKRHLIALALLTCFAALPGQAAAQTDHQVAKGRIVTILHSATNSARVDLSNLANGACVLRVRATAKRVVVTKW